MKNQKEVLEDAGLKENFLIIVILVAWTAVFLVPQLNWVFFAAQFYLFPAYYKQREVRRRAQEELSQ